jgi:3-oxoacyl-[acyl-carrier protein] reductase
LVVFEGGPSWRLSAPSAVSRFGNSCKLFRCSIACPKRLHSTINSGSLIIKNDGEGFYPDGVAVVIGGSGGIGSTICTRLAEHGTHVALSYRSDHTSAAATRDTIEACNRSGVAEQIDLIDPASVISFFARLQLRFGRIHTLVFASGADIEMNYVAEVGFDDWRRTIDGDLNGFFNVCKAAIPHLRLGGGSLVAITSAGNLRHPPRDILSTAPKAGIEALIRGIAREEGRFGIRANSIALGVIDTGLFHRLQSRVPHRYVQAMKDNTALGRFGSAREAADAAIFLTCSAGTFITGTSLVVDGGYSA